jgi:subtilisin family serine protease
VINLSFRPQDGNVNKALHDAIVANFTVTLSAGGGQGTPLENWGPFLVDHAIIAAASDVNDISGCAYGSGLTLYAPGVGMTAAGNLDDAHVYQGSQQPCVDSFAAPLAAGVAATYLQGHPSAPPSEVRTAILISRRSTKSGATTDPPPTRAGSCNCCPAARFAPPTWCLPSRAGLRDLPRGFGGESKTRQGPG